MHLPHSPRVCIEAFVSSHLLFFFLLFCRHNPGVSFFPFFFWPKRVGDALPCCGIPAWFRDPPIPHPRQKKMKIGFPEGKGRERIKEQEEENAFCVIPNIQITVWVCGIKAYPERLQAGKS